MLGGLLGRAGYTVAVPGLCLQGTRAGSLSLASAFTVPVLVEIEHEACDDQGDERHQDGSCHGAAVGSKVAADGLGI